jgi:hypothetical protein
VPFSKEVFVMLSVAFAGVKLRIEPFVVPPEFDA